MKQVKLDTRIKIIGAQLILLLYFTSFSMLNFLFRLAIILFIYCYFNPHNIIQSINQHSIKKFLVSIQDKINYVINLSTLDIILILILLKIIIALARCCISDNLTILVGVEIWALYEYIQPILKKVSEKANDRRNDLESALKKTYQSIPRYNKKI